MSRGERQKDVTPGYRSGWDNIWGDRAAYRRATEDLKDPEIAAQVRRQVDRAFAADAERQARLEADWERDPDNIGDGTFGSRSPMPAGYKGLPR